MREIKFRGKRIDTGEWVYGHYFTTPLTQENANDTSPKDGWFFLCGEKRHCISNDGVVFIVDPETVGEFTGLPDKNGKDIYEDDIVKSHHNGESNPIRYGEHIDEGYRTGFYWFLEVGENGFNLGDSLHRDIYGEVDHFEIVGNTHDNPELWKEVKR